MDVWVKFHFFSLLRYKANLLSKHYLLNILFPHWPVLLYQNLSFLLCLGLLSVLLNYSESTVLIIVTL